MLMQTTRFIAVAAAAVGLTVAIVEAQPDQLSSVRRSDYLEAERAVYFARAAEQRGDSRTAAQEYSKAISLVQSRAPVTLNLTKLVLAGELLPSIGRRMIYYDIKLYYDLIAQQQPSMRPEFVLENLRLAYGKMTFIETNNATWPYLQAVALAADRNYRDAFQKCREAARLPEGDESIRKKARSLAIHIKSAALEQEKMRDGDIRAYREYVESGAQALDFAMVNARASAVDARNSGDVARADMWERRYAELQRRREQIGR